jgi:hypothetical protein
LVICRETTSIFRDFKKEKSGGSFAPSEHLAYFFLHPQHYVCDSSGALCFYAGMLYFQRGMMMPSQSDL